MQCLWLNIRILIKMPFLYWLDENRYTVSTQWLRSYENEFELEAKGGINIIKKKINFDLIKVNQNQRAKEEDLKYFKSSFERIFFDENFFDMFEISKMRKFILDVI